MKSIIIINFRIIYTKDIHVITYKGIQLNSIYIPPNNNNNSLKANELYKKFIVQPVFL